MNRRRIDHNLTMPFTEEMDTSHMTGHFGTNGHAMAKTCTNPLLEQNLAFLGSNQIPGVFSPTFMDQNMEMDMGLSMNGSNPFNYVMPPNVINNESLSSIDSTDASIFSAAMSFQADSHSSFPVQESINLDPMVLELPQLTSNESQPRLNLPPPSLRAGRGSLTPSRSNRQQRRPTKSPGRSINPIHSHKARASSAPTPSCAIAGLEASLSSYSASSTFKRKSTRLLEHLKRLIEEEELYGDLGSEEDMCSSSASSALSDILTNSGRDSQTDNTSISSSSHGRATLQGDSQLATSSRSDNRAEARSFRCSYQDCSRAFKHFSDWKRHEENHYPQERYMCLTCLAPEGSSSCTICKSPFSMLETPESHHRVCLQLHDSSKHTFARKYHLNNHLRKQHGLEIADANEVSGGWNYSLSRNWPHVCHLCGVKFVTWDERMKHIAKHFQRKDDSSSRPDSRRDDDDDSNNDDNEDFDGRSGPPRKRVRWGAENSRKDSSYLTNDNNSSSTYYNNANESWYTHNSAISITADSATHICRKGRQGRSSSENYQLEIASKPAHQPEMTICELRIPFELTTGLRISSLRAMKKHLMVQNWIYEGGPQRLLCLQDFDDTQKSKLAVGYLSRNSGALSDGIFWFESKVEPAVVENLWDIACQSVSSRPGDEPDAFDFGHTWWKRHGEKIIPELSPKFKDVILSTVYDDHYPLGAAVGKGVLDFVEILLLYDSDYDDVNFMENGSFDIEASPLPLPGTYKVPSKLSEYDLDPMIKIEMVLDVFLVYQGAELNLQEPKRKSRSGGYYNAAAHLRRLHFKLKGDWSPRNLDATERRPEKIDDWPFMVDCDTARRNSRQPVEPWEQQVCMLLSGHRYRSHIEKEFQTEGLEISEEGKHWVRSLALAHPNLSDVAGFSPRYKKSIIDKKTHWRSIHHEDRTERQTSPSYLLDPEIPLYKASIHNQSFCMKVSL
ncbi:hypothetical protein HYFRA_00011858 [Hymenoscyphus fraxineus]|uniref:C2H2-type domain-containing protein n=1 Tax=Hymenoscyphus fraxineus TaxID=746836 RepID=A0A9N9PJP7_9HELO|nr:hypothetical protein HYFRA_00011858 [Hymenoscyphus fraxineus]